MPGITKRSKEVKESFLEWANKMGVGEEAENFLPSDNQMNKFIKKANEEVKKEYYIKEGNNGN